MYGEIFVTFLEPAPYDEVFVAYPEYFYAEPVVWIDPYAPIYVEPFYDPYAPVYVEPVVWIDPYAPIYVEPIYDPYVPVYVEPEVWIDPYAPFYGDPASPYAVDLWA
jgi:hypothetical protein